MVSVDFSFGNNLEFYLDMFSNFKVFPILAVIGLIYIITIALNIQNKESHFLFIGLNSILIIIICLNHGLGIVNNIDTFFNSNFLKNIYFYLFNMIVTLLIITNTLKSKRVDKYIKYIILVLYYLILINLVHSIYISNYLKNIMVLTVGNACSMVYFGNIVSILLYLFLILYWFIGMKKQKKRRLGNHL